MIYDFIELIKSNLWFLENFKLVYYFIYLLIKKIKINYIQYVINNKNEDDIFFVEPNLSLQNNPLFTDNIFPFFTYFTNFLKHLSQNKYQI